MQSHISSTILLTGLLAATPLLAVDPVYPQWWLDQGVVDSGDFPPPAETDPEYDAWMAENYKVPNLGQAKSMARAAYLAMDSEDAGSTGSSISTMISAFSTDPEDNYVALNIGQLKALAAPFYDLMHAASYTVELADGSIISNGNYPWLPSTPISDNYAIANLGQLKHVFSFDLSNWGGDWDSVPDSWKQQIVDFDANDAIDEIADVLALDDFDQDGISNYNEFLAQSEPDEFYNGISLEIEILTDANLVGRPGRMLLTPLSIKVTTDSGQTNLANKPVRFVVTQGTGTISAGFAGPNLSSPAVIFTDQNGEALVHFSLSTINELHQVKAVIEQNAAEISESFLIHTLAEPIVLAGGDDSIHIATPSAWGRNDSGQVGVNSGASTPTPTTIPNIGTLEVVALGNRHTAALAWDGKLYSWGANDFGQLGSGDFVSSLRPIEITAPSEWSGRSIIGLSAGDNFTIALLSDGTVWGWGDNSRGQLGADPAIIMCTNSPIEIEVDPTNIVSNIVAGPMHCIALTTAGEVWTWGDNRLGQLGNNTSSFSSSSAQLMLPGSLLAVDLAAGREHCGVSLEDGTIAIWGSNESGQLGVGDNIPVESPTVLADLADVIDVKFGDFFSIALCETGEVYIWGANWAGQLGDDGLAENSSIPVLATIGTSDIVQISAGRDHAFLVDANSVVYAWGDNSHGQLGDVGQDPFTLSF